MNVLSLIQSQLSSQTVGQISNAIGEDPEKTKSALETAFPAVLGSLVGKVTSSPGGVASVYNMVKEGQTQGGWGDSLVNPLSGFTGGGVPAGHQSLLNSLLGSKLGPISDFIANRCGIRGSSASSLLGMAAPILMGTISKLTSTQGMGASGLGQLLMSQIQHLRGAIPSDLASTLGIGGLLSGAETKAIVTPEPPVAAQAEPVRPTFEHEPVLAGSGGGRWLKYAWVPILIGLAGWFFANRSYRQADQGGASDPLPVVSTGHGERTPMVTTMKANPGSTADNLAKAISSGNWNQPVELRDLNIDASGALTDSAKTQLNEIGAVLNRSPGVKVQITDFADEEEASQSRANAIKSALATAGVSEARISAKGQTGSGMPTITPTK